MPEQEGLETILLLKRLDADVRIVAMSVDLQGRSPSRRVPFDVYNRGIGGGIPK
jgi:hypothetical protein